MTFDLIVKLHTEYDFYYSISTLLRAELAAHLSPNTPRRSYGGAEHAHARNQDPGTKTKHPSRHPCTVNSLIPDALDSLSTSPGPSIISSQVPQVSQCTQCVWRGVADDKLGTWRRVNSHLFSSPYANLPSSFRALCGDRWAASRDRTLFPFFCPGDSHWLWRHKITVPNQPTVCTSPGPWSSRQLSVTRLAVTRSAGSSC